MAKHDKLTHALLRGESMKQHVPEDREAVAAKIRRLRALRLAKAQEKPHRLLGDIRRRRFTIAATGMNAQKPAEGEAVH